MESHSHGVLHGIGWFAVMLKGEWDGMYGVGHLWCGQCSREGWLLEERNAVFVLVW